MIVVFDGHIKTLSGKNYDKTLVYCSCDNDTKCVVRRYVRPRITAHNHLIGAKLKNAGALYRNLPSAFIEALRVYARLYNEQLLPAKKLPLSGYNVFVKAVCKGKVRLSDLESMSRIVRLYGKTVESWIAHGLLDRVHGELMSAVAWIAEFVCERYFRGYEAEVSNIGHYFADRMTLQSMVFIDGCGFIGRSKAG